MFSFIKSKLYFVIAQYFRFFASIRLKRWNPKIIVITGSSGKTTLLHLVESQIGDRARYSHHANSSFGIPFDILGLHRKSLQKIEWISLFLKAPINALSAAYPEKIYIVEADCDRPGEGKFLASFLRPEIVLWVSTSKTHSMNFDSLIHLDKFKTIEEAVAYEFGYFLEYCSRIAIINGDSKLERDQIERTRAEVIQIKKDKELELYKIEKNATIFKIKGENYSLNALLPEEVFYSIAMCKKLVEVLNLPFDKNFSKYIPPPGRSSIFKGIKNITIIDSCYNANFSSMTAVLKMFAKYPADNKWVVIGDMLEQGESEKEEHEKLAELLQQYKFNKIILMGPRVVKYTSPLLEQIKNDSADKKFILGKFLGPKETLDYVSKNIKGGETILFKGSRFMEGIIQNLLDDPKDVSKLARREAVWERRRKSFGL